MTHTRIAVIGTGVMGANHARVARNLDDASLTVVVDQDADRAHAVAATADVTVAPAVDGVLDHFDAAVVAVPTAAHFEIATTLIEAGKHVMIEKPIAASVAEADALIEMAAAAGVVLAVGHIERFNAAVRELGGLLDDPIHIKAVRTSPFSPRISDGVVHDLMIHDLDIVLSLVGDATATSVTGIGRSPRSDTDDIAHAAVGFSNGLTASFETSRIAQQKVRVIEVTQPDSVIVADLVRQDITIHRMSRHEYLADDGVRYRQSSVVEIPFIDQRGEPLQRELADFITAIHDRRQPTVSGEAGRRALTLANLVSDSLHRS